MLSLAIKSQAEITAFSSDDSGEVRNEVLRYATMASSHSMNRSYAIVCLAQLHIWQHAKLLPDVLAEGIIFAVNTVVKIILASIPSGRAAYFVRNRTAVVTSPFCQDGELGLY